MTPWLWFFDKYNAQFGVTRVERSCGTCKYFYRSGDSTTCCNMENCSRDGEKPFVNEGTTCPKWMGWEGGAE